MNSALFITAVTHKNRSTWAKSLLLGTRRVIEFQDDPLGAGTEFRYLERWDRRVPSVLYKTNMVSSQFHGLLLESENEQFIYLQVVEVMNVANKKKEIPSVETRRINIEHIVKGWDIDTTSSYLIIDDGFTMMRMKTTHTIEEIDAVASESFSISVS
jgi:hypothetical protein